MNLSWLSSPAPRPAPRSLSRGWLAPLLAVAALGAGCDSDSDDGASVERFVTESGLSFDDCGSSTFAVSFPPVACPEAHTAAVACFQSHLSSCTPARLRHTYTSEEGDPIPQDYFIVPGASCTIVAFNDARADEFSATRDRIVTRRDCTAADITPGASDSCQQVQPRNCTDHP